MVVDAKEYPTGVHGGRDHSWLDIHTTLGLLRHFPKPFQACFSVSW